MSGPRQSSNLRRRSEAQRIHGRWATSHCTPGFSIVPCSLSAQLHRAVLRIDRARESAANLPAVVRTVTQMPLPTTPYPDTGANYGFYFGAKFGQNPGLWLIDPWNKKLAGAPIPEKAKAELLKFHAGDPGFEAPKFYGDEISRKLDSISIEDHIVERYAISRET